MQEAIAIDDSGPRVAGHPGCADVVPAPVDAWIRMGLSPFQFDLAEAGRLKLGVQDVLGPPDAVFVQRGETPLQPGDGHTETVDSATEGDPAGGVRACSAVITSVAPRRLLLVDVALLQPCGGGDAMRLGRDVEEVADDVFGR
ncbi:hypothetical protein [Candidatus Amarobacter glycogenicus]|uniref:hypothetical protein n=1 Tax=Candidatus Amarobacter glycogenicus TaxID=3140699 RepID=UPI0031CCB2BC